MENKKTAGWSLNDFYKNEKNSTARKEVEIEMNGEKKAVIISKVLIDQADKYGDIKSGKGAVKYFSEVLINHVFDVSTGERLFNKVEILDKSGYTSVEQFVNEQIPLGFVLDIQTAIDDFSNVKSRSERVNSIKN